MSGLFGGGRSPAPAPVAAPAVSAAQARAEERATSQEKAEMKGVQGRFRKKQSGGMRLLFSPARQEGPQATRPAGMSDADWLLLQKQRQGKSGSLGAGSSKLGGS
tara:strand:- start:389 stop:703 length:315 start_codon:yes stop_codon:yes gene_type:complete